jgi:glycosyltransferase involved in cell wall biosynthesis
MNKKQILFIINGIAKNSGEVSISGGDIRLLEIIKNTPDDLYDKYILTTQNGKELFSKYPDVKYKKMYVIDYSVKAGILSNAAVTFKSAFYHNPELLGFKDGIVYSSCEHIYDVLPALKYKIRKGYKWYSVYHWVEDYPWRDKRGNTPFLPRYAYWLNRVVSGLLIKGFSDKILAVSESTKEKLISIKKIKSDRIKSVYCGVNYDEIQNIVKKYSNEKGKKYDAVFMKRLNYGKGVKDLLCIWKEVVKANPKAKLAVIGDGSKDVLDSMHSFIDSNNLGKNVDLLGAIYDNNDKIRVINSSKLFLLPTHEENWAIVIGEAMAVGLPVVVSRLKEIVPIWKDNVVWCDVGDISQFSKAINDLLSDQKKRVELEHKAGEFVTRYDWKNIGKNELKF